MVAPCVLHIVSRKGFQIFAQYVTSSSVGISPPPMAFFFLLFPPNRHVRIRMADYITEGGQRTKYTGFDEGFIINISAAAGKKEAKQNTDRLLLLMAGQKKKKSNKKETHTICWWRIRVGGDTNYFVYTRTVVV